MDEDNFRKLKFSKPITHYSQTSCLHVAGFGHIFLLVDKGLYILHNYEITLTIFTIFIAGRLFIFYRWNNVHVNCKFISTYVGLSNVVWSWLHVSYLSIHYQFCEHETIILKILKIYIMSTALNVFVFCMFCVSFLFFQPLKYLL